MRTEFMNFLLNQAEIDPNVYLIVGDVGFSVIETFKERFRSRYINAGIAEQNMIGMAAGLAMAGKNVYVYSIVPFVTMRCFEQIRNDLCYQNLPVKLVGVGAGFSYGPMGVTHHALEDIAVMRILPEMTVIAPGHTQELVSLMPSIHNLSSPAYLRLAQNELSFDYPSLASIKISNCIELVYHPSQTIIAAGNALDLAFHVHKKLTDAGHSIGLISMPTIKPVNLDFIQNRPWKMIFTVEEHFIAGGIGEMIGRVIAESNLHPIIFHAFGINDFYFHEAGSRTYLKEKCGLSVENITTVIMHTMKEQNV